LGGACRGDAAHQVIARSVGRLLLNLGRVYHRYVDAVSLDA
jgi:hypothetical protein